MTSFELNTFGTEDQPQDPEQQFRQGRIQTGKVSEDGFDFAREFGSLGDYFVGARAGVEGFLQSLYQLADGMTNSVGLDFLLPDDFWEERYFERSKTIGGGLAEGMTQFLTMFVPAAGVISRGAQFGRVASGIAKTGRVVLPRKAGVGLQRAITKGRHTDPSFFGRLRTDLAAGAIADFTVFDGREQRLSNLIQETPLENPVSEWLAAPEEGDEQLTGRIKNVLEGMGLEMFFTPFMHALAMTKRGLTGRAANKSPDELLRETSESTDVDSYLDALEEGERRAIDSRMADIPIEERPGAGQFVKEEPEEALAPNEILEIAKMEEQGKIPSAAAKRMAIAELERKRIAAERRKGVVDDAKESAAELKEGRQVGGQEHNVFRAYVMGENVRVKRNKSRQYEWLRNDGSKVQVTDKDGSLLDASVSIREMILAERSGRDLASVSFRKAPRPAFPESKVIDTIKEMEASEDLPNASNPRNLDRATLVAMALERNSINLEPFFDDPGKRATLIRSVAKVIKDTRPEIFDKVKKRESIAQYRRRQTRIAKEIYGKELPPDLVRDREFAREIAKAWKDSEARLQVMQDGADQMAASNVVMMVAAGNAQKKLQEVAAKVGTEDYNRALAEGLLSIERLGAAISLDDASGTLAGRTLQARQRRVGLEKVLREVGRLAGKDTEALHQMMGTIASADSPLAALKLIKQARRSVSKWNLTTEFVMGAGMLSGFRTIGINMGSNAAQLVFSPLEAGLGAIGRRASQSVGLEPAVGTDALGRAMETAADGLAEMVRHVGDAMHAGLQVVRTGEPRVMAGSAFDPGRRTKGWTVQGFNQATARERNFLGAGEIKEHGVGAAIINTIGKISRYGPTALVATDDAVKYLAVRQRAQRILKRAGRERTGLNGEELDHWVEDRMQQIVHDGQLMTEEVLYEREFQRLAKENPDMPLTDLDDATRDAVADKWNSEEGLLNRMVAQDAGRHAQELPFQTPIPRDATATTFDRLARLIQDAVDTAPGLVGFVPFVQTPYNIIKWASNRTVDPVLAGVQLLFSKDLRQAVQDARLGGGFEFARVNEVKSRLLRDLIGDVDLKGIDPASPEAQAIIQARKEDAYGRIATGIGLSLIGYGAVKAGMITGRGPSEPNQRKVLIDAGWRPYSIKVGDSYVEYRRLDPFATILGTWADLYTVQQYLPPEDRGTMEAVSTALVTALTQNVTNKTYMSGLKSLMDVIHDPAETFPRQWPRLAAGWFVPTGPSEVAGFLAGDHDPYMREVRGAVDAMLNKLVPYYGESLDPVRNFMGEKVERIKSLNAGVIQEFSNITVPLAYSEAKSDLISQEMRTLQHGFMPPPTKRRGVEFRDFQNARGQSAYDRMMELRGEVTIGGKTLRRSLMDLMRSREYRQMAVESTLEVESPRIGEIRRIVSRYDRASMNSMLREFPELMREIRRVEQAEEMSRFQALDLVR